MPVDNYVASMLYSNTMSGYGIRPTLVKQSNKKSISTSNSTHDHGNHTHNTNNTNNTNMIALYDSQTDHIHMYNNANNQSNIMHSGKSHGYEKNYA